MHEKIKNFTEKYPWSVPAEGCIHNDLMELDESTEGE